MDVQTNRQMETDIINNTRAFQFAVRVL